MVSTALSVLGPEFSMVKQFCTVILPEPFTLSGTPFPLFSCLCDHHITLYPQLPPIALHFAYINIHLPPIALRNCLYLLPVYSYNASTPAGLTAMQDRRDFSTAENIRSGKQQTANTTVWLNNIRHLSYRADALLG